MATLNRTARGAAWAAAFVIALAGGSACPGDEGTGTTGRVFGKVTANGQPVANAGVQLSGSADRISLTDGAGDYSFSDLFPGDYQVTAAATGLTCPAVNLTVTTGLAEANIPCTPLTGTLNVTATSLGSPVSGATVNLTGPTPGTGVTGSNGIATFTNRLPGSYGVTANRTGFVCNPTTANVTAGATVNAALSCTPTP